MNEDQKKVIIISALNIREGGPLTIVNNCLSELANSDLLNRFKIVTCVHKKSLCLHKGITYLEFPKTKNRLYYLYYEYFGLKKKLSQYNIELFISLTDKTPNVKANKKAVYIHNPTPFFEYSLNDVIHRPFLVLYKLFYAKLCSINVKSNNYVIVQQDWLRTSYSSLLNFTKSKIIVFPPVTVLSPKRISENKKQSDNCVTFIFASLPRSFKNFEIICEATKLVKNTVDDDFRVLLTLNGTENKYASDIYKKYRNEENIEFLGLIPHNELMKLFEDSNCLIFPSRLETWGLAISEYSILNKPMLLADLPYAHNTARGSKKTSFFNVNKADELAEKMIKLLKGDYSFLKEVPKESINAPYTTSWFETFNFLLAKHE
jgi:glycosyltransferase involved in cell wall biosynthesis